MEILHWITQDTAHILFTIFLICGIIALIARARLEYAKYKAGYYGYKKRSG